MAYFIPVMTESFHHRVQYIMKFRVLGHYKLESMHKVPFIDLILNQLIQDKFSIKNVSRLMEKNLRDHKIMFWAYVVSNKLWSHKKIILFLKILKINHQITKTKIQIKLVMKVKETPLDKIFFKSKN